MIFQRISNYFSTKLFSSTKPFYLPFFLPNPFVYKTLISTKSLFILFIYQTLFSNIYPPNPFSYHFSPNPFPYHFSTKSFLMQFFGQILFSIIHLLLCPLATLLLWLLLVQLFYVISTYLSRYFYILITLFQPISILFIPISSLFLPTSTLYIHTQTWTEHEQFIDIFVISLKWPCPAGWRHLPY